MRNKMRSQVRARIRFWHDVESESGTLFAASKILP
jgi:hypothetical protein